MDCRRDGRSDGSKNKRTSPMDIIRQLEAEQAANEATEAKAE